MARHASDGETDAIVVLDPLDLLDRLRAQPWAPALLDAAAGLEGIHVVGGAVRDLALDRVPVDLDVVVEGDAVGVARTLGERMGAPVDVHDRFGTATVRTAEVPINLASTRTESYAAPGALPEVRAGGSLDDDLRRRDFTVNALALALDGSRLSAAPHSVEDLEAGRIRVLHDRSFRDDPTRLLRAVRYESRLGFAIDSHTSGLVRQAARGGALDTVSGPRLRDELIDLLSEDQALRSLERLPALGLDRALHPRWRHDPAAARRALELAPHEARRPLVLLALALRDVPADERAAWVERLALGTEERDAVVAAAGAQELVQGLEPGAAASEIAARFDGRPAEVAVVAGALGAPEAARRWLEELRHVRLEIGGEDLVAAGIPQGPAIGAGLAAARRRKLDGEIAGREAELQAALEAAGRG